MRQHKLPYAQATHAPDRDQVHRLRHADFCSSIGSECTDFVLVQQDLTPFWPFGIVPSTSQAGQLVSLCMCCAEGGGAGCGGGDGPHMHVKGRVPVVHEGQLYGLNLKQACYIRRHQTVPWLQQEHYTLLLTLRTTQCQADRSGIRELCKMDRGLSGGT